METIPIALHSWLNKGCTFCSSPQQALQRRQFLYLSIAFSITETIPIALHTQLNKRCTFYSPPQQALQRRQFLYLSIASSITETIPIALHSWLNKGCTFYSSPQQASQRRQFLYLSIVGSITETRAPSLGPHILLSVVFTNRLLTLYCMTTKAVPVRTMREPGHWTEVIGQIHSPTTLSHKITPVPPEQEAGWASEQFWTFWRRDIFLASVGIRAPNPVVRSSVSIPTVCHMLLLNSSGKHSHVAVELSWVQLCLLLSLLLRYITFTPVTAVLTDCRRTQPSGDDQVFNFVCRFLVQQCQSKIQVL